MFIFFYFFSLSLSLVRHPRTSASFGIPACLDRPTPHPRLESDYIIIQPFYSIIVLSKSPKPVYWRDLLQTIFIASLGIFGLYACMRAFLFLTTLYP